MASEAVNKILAAEADSNRKTAEAKQRRDELINNANGDAARAIQKKLGDATAASHRMRTELDAKLSDHKKRAEEKCHKDIEQLKLISEKNMDKTVEEIIRKFF